MTALSPELFLRHLRADTDRMLDVATDLDAPVPTCPGWTVRDVLQHTGVVFSHKVACMRLPGGPQQRSDWDHGPDDGAEVLGWFRERRDELVTELETRGPEAPSFTWYETDQTVGFWYRRMAQEAAVHRVDVESGTGAESPVDHDLALDGVDEVLDWFLVYQSRGADGDQPDAPGRGTVAVRTGEHIWRVGLTPDGVGLSREPGPFEGLVSGEPSELYLWLWGRRPDTAVVREGDPVLLAGLRARLQAVTQ